MSFKYQTLLGDSSFTGDDIDVDTATFSTIQITTGAGSNKVLTSDATGYGTWQTPSVTLAGDASGSSSSTVVNTLAGGTIPVSSLVTLSVLNAEVTRATNAENTLTTNLASELTRALAAEATLTTNLSNEVTRATGAESTLTTSVNTESTRALAAEATLTTNLATEVTRATAAEAVLTTNLASLGTSGVTLTGVQTVSNKTMPSLVVTSSLIVPDIASSTSLALRAAAASTIYCTIGASNVFQIYPSGNVGVNTPGSTTYLFNGNCNGTLDVSGISKFTNMTDSTFGTIDTGSVQLLGGMSVAKGIRAGGDITTPGNSSVNTAYMSALNTGTISATGMIGTANTLLIQQTMNRTSAIDLYGVGTEYQINGTVFGQAYGGRVDVDNGYYAIELRKYGAMSGTRELMLDNTGATFSGTVRCPNLIVTSGILQETCVTYASNNHTLFFGVTILTYAGAGYTTLHIGSYIPGITYKVLCKGQDIRISHDYGVAYYNNRFGTGVDAANPTVFGVYYGIMIITTDGTNIYVTS